jgi:hypothetical protein
VTNLTPSEAGSGEITVTADGYGGQGFDGDPGQSSRSGSSPTVTATYTEVTIVAWLNASAVVLPTGENSILQGDLKSPGSCAIDVGSWALGGTKDLILPADWPYASAYLVQNSGNSAPPITINPFAYYQGGNFRMFNDYGNPSGNISVIGITPDPCGTGIISNWLQAGQASPYNGATGTSPSGMKYLLNEGRVGAVGQAVNQTLNGVSTPWIWSVIEFSPSGVPTYSKPGLFPAVFPTYSVYINGVLSNTYPQISAGTFATYSQSYQFTPSQIP